LRRHGIVALALLSTIVAACSAQTNANPTSDDAAPNLIPGRVVTSQGTEAASLYLPVFLIAVAIFVLVEGLLVYMAWRFRRRRASAELPAQTHGNNTLEMLWTAIPFVVVLAMFVASMSVLNRVQARDDQPAVTVDVTAFQWQWTFEYRDAGLSYTGVGKQGPEMVLPVGDPVRIRLHAQDVIHSFYVPMFFRKLDAVPGRVNELDVVVNEPGTFGGQCAEFCGLAHPDMFFTVRAVERADYEAWLDAEIDKANATPPPPPSGQPGATIAIAAVNTTTFDPPDLAAPADTPLTFQFENRDPSAPHNIAIKGANPDGSDWAGLPVTQGGQHATYQAPPLKAATYEFYCSVHPTTMRGTLTVQ
jgi:cytochrome c oxidase subunit 2